MLDEVDGNPDTLKYNGLDLLSLALLIIGGRVTIHHTSSKVIEFSCP